LYPFKVLFYLKGKVEKGTVSGAFFSVSKKRKIRSCLVRNLVSKRRIKEVLIDDKSLLG